MQNTRDIDELAAAMVDLIGLLSRPGPDDLLLCEAGVDLDRALFRLLVALDRHGSSSVGALADRVGRDHTTVSRQLAKLEGLGLIVRRSDGADRRARAVTLTSAGETTAHAIASARRRLLSRALADWTAADRAALTRLNRRLVDALAAGVGD